MKYEGDEAMLEKVKKNKYGFYELKNKPTEEEQKKNFEETYYQESQAAYEASYSEEEKKFFYSKISQKEMAFRKAMLVSEEKISILDVGCGEGFLLKYFKEKGNDVLGVDFSKYGIEHNNPEMLPYFIQGDCYQVLNKLITQDKKFDVVNMDAVLDMVQRPDELLEIIKELLKENGVLVCKVGNNYSSFQLGLMEQGILDREYWLDEEGHSWYFNKDGFINFFNEHGYYCMDLYAEGLIEFNLLNELTNYYENPEVGKACYKAKIRMENMLNGISPQKTNEIMRLFGQMGLGRELVGIFKNVS